MKTLLFIRHESCLQEVSPKWSGIRALSLSVPKGFYNTILTLKGAHLPLVYRLPEVFNVSLYWHGCCVGVTVLFRAQSSPLSSLSVMRKNRNQTMAKKNKKLVDPNHNGYEVASGSGSELQKSLLAFPANRAFFGSYSHSCAIPGRYVHKQMHIHDRGERGGEETDCCYESLGQQGALKCKQSQCGSWCPVHRGRSLKTLQWSQGEKPARHSNQGPARSWSALLPASGWAQSWVGWDGSPPPSIWRSFPPVFQQMTKVWAISPGFQPAVLTALYFQPFPVQLKVVKA